MSWWIGSPAALPSRSKARGEGGFTLLEVLVAFAIMAVAMAAILQAFSGGLDATRRSQAAGEALSTARSLLDRVGAELPIVPGLRSGGSASSPSWSVRIARRKSPLDDLQESERSYALFDVVVSVTVPGAAPVSLATVRMAPVP